MSPWSDKHIVIVCGGESSEREVSLRTGAAFASALRSVGLNPTVIDLQRSRVRELVDANADVVLNAMHGRDGEDGSLQGLLELLEVPYTGSGVAASALAMDKSRAKCVFLKHGVPTPDWATIERTEAGPCPLPVPFVAKPSLEGSSVGISLVNDAAEWPNAWRVACGDRGPVVAEAYVRGRELTVGVQDGEPMGIIEIQAAAAFYDYDAKYASDKTRYVTPTLDPAVEQAVLAAGIGAYNALGCRGVARTDVLLDADDQPWVLEVNTIPGMTQTSLVPKLAAARGVAFPDFVLGMLATATTDAQLRNGEGAGNE